MIAFCAIQFILRMILLLQRTITVLAVTTSFLSSIGADDSSANRNQKCANTKHNQFQLSYPFGLSDESPIRLNCNNAGEITIAGFRIQNITGENIIIDFPSKCDRPIGEFSRLFGRNYAPTWKNGLLLHNCSSNLTKCGVGNRVMENFEGCDLGIGDETSCYYEENEGSDFMTKEYLDRSGCEVLFSSFAVDLRNSSSSITAVLESNAMALGWWLVEGLCECSDNATCVEVKLDHGGARVAGDADLGFRCQCKEGFEGDGFSDGDGCWPVSDCSASSNKIHFLIGGILAGATVMAALTIFCFYARRRYTRLQSQMSAKHLLSQAAGSSKVPFYPYKEIERATNGFSEKQRLGTGAYGTVYAGKLHNDEWVAFKKIKNRDSNGIEQVMNEIKLLSSVSHPNLVRLLGCCIENDEQILVYEFMPNGTLSQHLQRERGNGLPWTIRLTVATETARAIAYLHSSIDPPIYHRDIKSSNILLDYNFNSKVADFGLSRYGMVDDSHISTGPQGTPGYLDPQYHQNFHLSDKSDVYSFGVLLVEIITALKVVDFSRPHYEVNLAALAVERIGKGRVDEIIDPFLEPNRDAWTLSSLHRVAELAFRCLAFHRDMRPSMMEVADELEQIRMSGWAPMEENNICTASSVGSSCSSPYAGSEKSIIGTMMTGKKGGGVGSRRLIVQQRPRDCVAPGMVEMKNCSPVSVQDPWLSEMSSSPSTNSLLGKGSG